MSQVPRWYRKLELERISGINRPESGLWDQQYAQNVRKAIRDTLDEQDRKYERALFDEVTDIKRKLTRLYDQQ